MLALVESSGLEGLFLIDHRSPRPGMSYGPWGDVDAEIRD